MNQCLPSASVRVDFPKPYELRPELRKAFSEASRLQGFSGLCGGFGSCALWVRVENFGKGRYTSCHGSSWCALYTWGLSIWCSERASTSRNVDSLTRKHIIQGLEYYPQGSSINIKNCVQQPYSNCERPYTANPKAKVGPATFDQD